MIETKKPFEEQIHFIIIIGILWGLLELFLMPVLRSNARGIAGLVMPFISVSFILTARAWMPTRGTVFLAAGTFDFGDSGVEVNKECTLKGEKGPGGELVTTIINGGYWRNSFDLQFTIVIQSGDVTIKNMLFDETCICAISFNQVFDGEILVKDNIINSDFGIEYNTPPI